MCQELANVSYIDLYNLKLASYMASLMPVGLLANIFFQHGQSRSHFSLSPSPLLLTLLLLYCLPSAVLGTDDVPDVHAVGHVHDQNTGVEFRCLEMASRKKIF
jgi:hypothetical protein